MLILSLTTDKVSVISSTTATLDVVATYVDRVTSTGVVGAANRQLTAISTATTTDIVAVPGADTTRNVQSITIRNKSAASDNDVTVQINANGTLYELHKVTLLAGETLVYLDNFGFNKVQDSSRNERVKVMTADSVHATTATFADITGLTVPLKAGVLYAVFACLHHINDATTTGSQFGYNIGAAPTDARFSTIDTVTGSTTASVHSAGSIIARDTAITAQTTGSVAVTLAIIAGFIIPSADGTFALRATSEVTVAAGLTVKAGSFLRVFRPTG